MRYTPNVQVFGFFGLIPNRFKNRSVGR